MFMPRLCLVLPIAERAQLTDVAASGRTPQRIAVRAQLLLWLADHVRPSEIARRLRISRNHVHYWVARYVEAGVGGVLKDAPRPGRRKRLTPARIEAIVTATLTTTPPGATHWSTRTMARAGKMSEKTVRNIWHQQGLQPHRVTRFKLSTDPHFVDKLRDVMGLYLHPPDHAVVFCVDEKSGIQALDRTQPVLPLRPASPRARRTTTAAMAPRVSSPPCGCSTGWCSATVKPSATRWASSGFSIRSTRSRPRTRRFT